MRHALLLATMLLWPFVASAGDLDERRAAAERYEAVASTSQMILGSIDKFAEYLPQHDRATLVETMTSLVDEGKIERMAIDVMAETFTLEEINALVDFFSSAIGQSVHGKQAAFSAELLQRTVALIHDGIARARSSVR